VVTEKDDFYQVARHYLGLSDQDLKRGFLLIRGVEMDGRQRKCSFGECIFKRCPGDLEATEELWLELTQ